LHRGGVQRLFLGNLKAGEHELIAFLHRKGPARSATTAAGPTIKFDKAIGASTSSSRSATAAASQQPEFVVRQWE
jgi:hypothetical protein